MTSSSASNDPTKTMPSTAGEIIARDDNEDTRMMHLCQWLRDYHIDREMTPERLAESYALEKAATVIESLHWRAKSAEARMDAMIKRFADISLAGLPSYMLITPAPAVTPKDQPGVERR